MPHHQPTLAHLHQDCAQYTSLTPLTTPKQTGLKIRIPTVEEVDRSGFEGVTIPNPVRPSRFYTETAGWSSNSCAPNNIKDYVRDAVARVTLKRSQVDDSNPSHLGIYNYPNAPDYFSHHTYERVVSHVMAHPAFNTYCAIRKWTNHDQRRHLHQCIFGTETSEFSADEVWELAIRADLDNEHNLEDVVQFGLLKGCGLPAGVTLQEYVMADLLGPEIEKQHRLQEEKHQQQQERQYQKEQRKQHRLLHHQRRALRHDRNYRRNPYPPIKQHAAFPKLPRNPRTPLQYYPDLRFGTSDTQNQLHMQTSRGTGRGSAGPDTPEFVFRLPLDDSFVAIPQTPLGHHPQARRAGTTFGPPPGFVARGPADNFFALDVANAERYHKQQLDLAVDMLNAQRARGASGDRVVAPLPTGFGSGRPCPASAASKGWMPPRYFKKDVNRPCTNPPITTRLSGLCRPEPTMADIPRCAGWGAVPSKSPAPDETARLTVP